MQKTINGQGVYLSEESKLLTKLKKEQRQCELNEHISYDWKFRRLRRIDQKIENLNQKVRSM